MSAAGEGWTEPLYDSIVPVSGTKNGTPNGVFRFCISYQTGIEQRKDCCPKKQQSFC